MSCENGKQYYVCSKGPFHGCCSVDPCTDGICPDEDSHVTHLSLSPTTAAQKTSSASSFSTSSTSSTPTTSVISSTTAQSHAVSPTTATATPSVTSGPESRSTEKDALIGGIVGGVVAALAILAIVICLINRRRKKQGKRFTLLRLNLRDDEKEDRFTVRTQDEMTAFQYGPNHHSSPFTSPGNKTLNSPDLSPDTSLTDSYNSATTTYTPLPPIPPSSALIPSITDRTSLTPELPDTGFYRQRAELATNSQSELINVPAEIRQQKRAAVTKSPAKSTASSPIPDANSSGAMHKQQTPPIVTKDGVVLTPNLDQGSARRAGNVHVMSFMQYESRPGSRKGNGKGSQENEGGNGQDVGLGLKGVDVAGSGSREKGRDC